MSCFNFEYSAAHSLHCLFSIVYSLPLGYADCMLYAVGKPVYHKWTDLPYGSWLKDPSPRNEWYDERVWTAFDTGNRTVFEYSDRETFRNNNSSHIYTLTKAFSVSRAAASLFSDDFRFGTKRNVLIHAFSFRMQGNSPTIYNGSFYYFCRDFGGLVVRFDFELQREMASVHLPNVATSGDHYLYTTKYNYVDLSADDNGIWAIYTTSNSSHTNVVKVIISVTVILHFPHL